MAIFKGNPLSEMGVWKGCLLLAHAAVIAAGYVEAKQSSSTCNGTNDVFLGAARWAYLEILGAQCSSVLNMVYTLQAVVISGLETATCKPKPVYGGWRCTVYARKRC